jgi:hypothetical protein
VEVIRFRAPRSIAAGLGTLVLTAFAALAPAHAATTSSLDVGDQTVVNVFVRGAGNDVTIRTWDRPTVQIESDETPDVDRRSATFGPGGQPLTQPVGPANFRQPDGSRVLVPPEDFPLAGMRTGPHDVVRVQTGPRSHLVVTVPANVGLVRTVVGSGTTDVEGYRGANLFVLQGGGRVRVANTTTTAFVQLGGGRLQAVDDTFERLRARANGANLIFEGCRSKEIEASTIRGNVVYDGGRFDPGVARFESRSGTIALGVTGAAQLTGRSENGRVYTAFAQRGTPIQQNAPNAATVTVGAGGALVNALSAQGDVYLYDGSLRERRTMPPEFQRLQQAFTRRANAPARRAPPPASHLRRQTRAKTSAASRRRA